MRTALAAVLVTALVGPAVGQDAVKYEIKVCRRKAGDRCKVTRTGVEDMTVTIKDGGAGQVVPYAATLTEAFTEHVEAVGGDGKPSRLTRAYTKARVAWATPGVFGFEGKTVTIRRESGKSTYAVDGQPLAGTDAEQLDDEFKDPSVKRFEDFLPKETVQVGRGWTIPKVDPPAGFDRDGMRVTFDPTKRAAEGKLTKVYQRDGRRFGVVTMTLTHPATRLKMGDEALLAAGSAVTEVVTADWTIDGGPRVGTFGTATTVTLTAESPSGTVSVAGTSKFDETVEPADKP